MEQAERGSAARSQNVIHILPRTTDALARSLAPALERVDVAEPSVQVLVVTPDAESAIAAGEVAYAITGARRNRGVADHRGQSRGAHSRRPYGPRRRRPGNGARIAGSALSAQARTQVRAVVLAWIDDEIQLTDERSAALETLFSEIPKEASRVLLVRRDTPRTDEFAERFLRSARKVGGSEVAAPAAPDIVPASTPLRYVSVSAASRPAALRRLLDELDPPSASIVVRDPASEADASQTIKSLGYRRADDPVRVARYESIPAAHTVVLYDAPVLPSELAAAAAVTPVQTIALATPRDMVPLHELAGTLMPMALDGAGAIARSRDSQLRAELDTVLTQGLATREVLALEPLLDRYDGISIAAAALRLLEAERARISGVMPMRVAAASSGQPQESKPQRDRGDRGERGDRGSHGAPRFPRASAWLTRRQGLPRPPARRAE